MNTAATPPTTAAKKMLRRALNDGGALWISYGQAEVTGFVLSVDKHSATVQDQTDGVLHTVAFVAIDEMVEA